MKAFSTLQKLTFSTVFMFLVALQTVNATHNRAGEITYRLISQNTIEVTLTTFTDTRSVAADRPEVEIFWGDNTSDIVNRTEQVDIGDNIFRNRYVTQYSYPGTGTYTIHFTDPNRVEGVNNISNSVNTQFHLETTVRLDAMRGGNNSVQLLREPIDFAKVGVTFKHNPSAWDPDGDSLHFRLVPPMQGEGEAVHGYFQPPASNELTLNSETGELVWDAPTQTGIYDIAMEIREFRNGVMMGSVIRDMQIIVEDTDNNPPEIEEVRDTCVNAGDDPVLDFQVYASDPDVGDEVTLTATGGPFEVPISPATLSPNPSRGINETNANFFWEITCDHIRKWPYQVVFRAKDNHPRVPLTDKESFRIRVIGPEPEDLTAEPIGDAIDLEWELPRCDNQVGYIIYRRAQPSGWNPGSCDPGVPGHTGFRAIDTITDRNLTEYRDDNHGQGLVPGVNYCYRITAVYLGEGQFEVAEGLASIEVCQDLNKDIPVITHADVEVTHPDTGRVYVEWSKPTDTDTIQFPGPYTYELLHSAGTDASTNMNTIATFNSQTFSGLNDTTFTVENLDTENQQHVFRVAMYATIDGDDYLVGRTHQASTIWLATGLGHKQVQLSWTFNQPWHNEEYTVFRLNDTTNSFDSLTTVSSEAYADTGLTVGQTYCYYIKATGLYGMDGFAEPFINRSQVNCGVAADTVPPCPPVLTAIPECNRKQNFLQWNFNDPDYEAGCEDQTGSYNVYFRNTRQGKMELIGSYEQFSPMNYTDNRPELQTSLAGCYAITAVDSFGYESDFSNTECVDNCPEYKLPNVFSPTGDKINDIFTPKPGYRFIDKVEFTVFNRWGRIVFRTEDPEIKWDGTDQNTGNPLEAGTYYYKAIIHEKFLDGTENYTISGTIHLMR